MGVGVGVLFLSFGRHCLINVLLHSQNPDETVRFQRK